MRIPPLGCLLCAAGLALLFLFFLPSWLIILAALMLCALGIALLFTKRC